MNVVPNLGISDIQNTSAVLRDGTQRVEGPSGQIRLNSFRIGKRPDDPFAFYRAFENDRFGMLAERDVTFGHGRLVGWRFD